MIDYPSKMKKLVDNFRKLPGVGPKMASRMAMRSFQNIALRQEMLMNLHDLQELKVCQNCGAISDTDICETCSDESRDSTKLMLVEDFSDMVNLENGGEYMGFYVILAGLISPLNNILPDNLNINLVRDAVSRQLTKLSKDQSLEIIFALNPSLEGDSTIYYLTEDLRDTSDFDRLVFTRLAMGIPKGSDIDYIDQETLKLAFRSRGSI